VPAHVELDLLLSFLLQSEKIELIHTTIFAEALSDWVTRLLEVIKVVTFVTLQHKRRATSPALAEHSTALSTPSTSLMAVMFDAMGTDTVTTLVSSTPPRFKVCVIDDHEIDRTTGRLSYNVHWEREGSLPTNEPYSHLHHLDVLGKYERSIQPSRGKNISGLRRQAATKWRAYKLQKSVELLELVSEDDTDSNASETAEVADLDLDVSAYLVDTPLIPLLDSPASTSTDY
jgi:hypothetical protein